MKIIQVIPRFSFGGAEIMCENLSYGLKKLGEEVVVISLYTYHSEITERLEANNIKIIYLDKKRGIDVSIIFKLHKVLKKEKAKVIHTHMNTLKYAFWATFFTGTKCKIHTLHSIAKKENGLLDRKINKILFKFGNVIPVALSEMVQATIKDEYKLPLNKIPIIFNGIDLKKCIPKTSYEINGKIKILHIGRFVEVKNHVGLLNAFEKFHKIYPNSEMGLIGIGEKKEEIEELVNRKKLNDAVIFYGTQDNVYKFLSKCDIFILPSLYEGIPMTLLEAMGTGLPIIATNVGGIPDILTNNHDALLTSLNNEDIVNSLIRITKDEKLRIKLGKNAKEKSKEFSSLHMAEEYISVYKKYI